MFENVTYEYYHGTMGRSAVPSQADFDFHKEQVVARVKSILHCLREREAGGIDRMCCMLIEGAYFGAKSGAADGRIETSYSADGVSQSFDVQGAKTFAQKNAATIRAYCELGAWR